MKPERSGPLGEEEVVVVPTGGKWSAPEKKKKKKRRDETRTGGLVLEATGAGGDSMVSKPRRLRVTGRQREKGGSYQNGFGGNQL